VTPQEKRESILRLREAIGQVMIGGKRPPKFTAKQRKAVWDKYEGLCAGCDDPLQPGWHIDHIRAHADGGTHDLGNWRALCPSCHIGKTRSENSDRAKPNRIRKVEAEGRQPSRIRSNPKIPSRPFQKRRAM